MRRRAAGADGSAQYQLRKMPYRLVRYAPDRLGGKVDLNADRLKKPLVKEPVGAVLQNLDAVFVDQLQKAAREFVRFFIAVRLLVNLSEARFAFEFWGWKKSGG